MAIPDIYGPPDVYPVLEILVDGEEILARPDSRYGAYIPYAPAALLEGGTPLLPAQPARRVALYTDSAGPSDGCLAPLIGARGDLVTWTDFRRFAGVSDPPIITESVDLASPGGVPDLAFDRRQYTDEVVRVTREREWESEPWQTALLLDQHLSGPGLGTWELGWVEPHPERRFVVTLFDDENPEERLKVVLRSGPGSPEQQAHSMARYLTDTPPEQWPLESR
jgi:hypothetical protein